MTKRVMSLAAFYDELAKHDWYYDQSDDSKTYVKGQQNYARLAELSAVSPEHSELMLQYRTHMWSGKPWGTSKAPKPERPQE